MKKLLILLIAVLPISLFAQGEYTYQTFKSTSIINTQSIETLQKRRMDVLIGHRFGDMFGDAGGWTTFYGLEAAEDVLFGLDFGITDNTLVGISRTKGSGPHKMLLNLQAKHKFLHQREGGMPITLAAYGLMSISTMAASPNEADLNFFEKSAHRYSYTAQLLIAKKFNDRFSLQITPGYTHRNIVVFGEENGLLSLGIGGRIGLTKHHAIVFDSTIPFYSSTAISDVRTIPLGFGWEIDTGGHRFQINFTNSGGMSANDFIPYTASSWNDGQFRLGFTISRWFNF